MRIKLQYLLTVLLSSCALFVDKPKFVPSGDYALLVLSTKYVSHTASSLVYNATLLLLDKNLAYGDYSLLSQSNFSFLGNGTSTVSNFATSHIRLPATAPPIALLDQSGSYSTTDPNNLRSQVVSKYFEDCAQSNSFQAGGFSKGGLLSSEPIEFLTNGFTNSWQMPAQGLFALAQLTGGESNLYDAVNTSVGALADSPLGLNRNDLVLIHANDQASKLSLNSVLQNALNANVQVNITSSDSSVDKLSVGSLAIQTGGWLAICNTPAQMVTVIANWNRLTSGQVTAYTFTITLQSDSTLFSGDAIVTKVNILNTAVNSAYLYIKIP